MGALMDLLSGAGAALDVPGSMVRDTLGGRNPFDQLATPFSWDNRLTGRDLLQQYGLAGEDPTGANMAGGVAAEMALDPLTWIGLGGAAKLPGALRQFHQTLKARQMAKGAIGPYLGSAAKGAVASAATSAARPAKALSAGMRPATAASFASPALGAYFIGDNMSVPPEEQEAWKNWLGTGLMAAPLAFGMARGVGKRLSAEDLLAVPLDQLKASQRRRLNDLARRQGADPAVTKRVQEMHQRDPTTKPKDLRTEADTVAAQSKRLERLSSVRAPKLSADHFLEKLQRLKAEHAELKSVKPKTLSKTERAARDKRINYLRYEIWDAKKQLAVERPPAGPAVPAPETLSELQKQETPKASGKPLSVEELLEVPLDQLTKPQRQRLNHLARRQDADSAVVSRVEAMWQRDIRTKPQDLMSEAEKAAAKAAFREAGATRGSPATPKTPVDPAVATPETQPAAPQTLSDLLQRKRTGGKQPMPETPEARPTAPTPPTEGAGPMITLNEAFTEHYDHMQNYLRKTFRDKGFRNANTLDDLTQEAMTRVLISAQNRTDVVFPAGEAGWKALEPFVKKRAIDAMRVHLKPGRGTVGTAGSREDAYKLGRSEEGLSAGAPDYADRVGRMSTIADQAPTPAQQAQLNELPQVFEIVQELSGDHPSKPIYFDAMFEDRFMLDKLRATRQPYKAPEWTKMADKIGVVPKTVYNWTKEFAERLDAMGVNLEAYRDILPMLLAALGLGGAAGGALARRVANIPQTPEAPSLSVPAAGPFEFATLDGQPISPPYI